MDPIAHTLAGASLAETRLGRLTRLAPATLILGANAPDIDVVAQFVSTDVGLGFRRGWTHGIVAMAALPCLLAGLMLLADRLVRARRPAAARASPRALVALAYVSVLSHPALDWLNNYGIRLLMPFDGRWFYGDAIFIVDPWIWLLMAAPVVVARTRSAVGIAGWSLFAAIATFFITVGAADATPAAAKVVWCLAAAAVIALRLRRPSASERLTLVTFTIVGVYIGGMIAGTWIARRQAAAWLNQQGVDATVRMAGPVPANPFVRDVVAAATDRYYFVEIDWLAEHPIRFSQPSMPIGRLEPVVEAALRAPRVQGLRVWMRLPAFEVQPLENGYRVIIQDVRYTRTRRTGIGFAVVELDEHLRVKSRTED